MKIIVAIVISLIVGNYALSPPLADVGMVPDYALDEHDFEEIELEIDGDYINLDIDSNQGEEKELKENDFSFNIIAGSKSRSVDIMVEGLPSIHIPEGIESGTFTYTAKDGTVATIGNIHHYNHHAFESSITDIPDEPLSESVEAVVEEDGFSFSFHPGKGGHYTLPVETNPTI